MIALANDGNPEQFSEVGVTRDGHPALETQPICRRLCIGPSLPQYLADDAPFHKRGQVTRIGIRPVLREVSANLSANALDVARQRFLSSLADSLRDPSTNIFEKVAEVDATLSAIVQVTRLALNLDA